MKDEKVTFEMVFPIEPYRNFKLGYEGSIDPNETFSEATMKAYKKVMDAGDQVYASLRLPISSISSVNSSSAIVPEIPVEKVLPIEDRIKGIINDLQKCTTIPKPDGIDSYYSLAQQYPEVKVAYDIKKAELVKKETAQILAATEANCLKPKKL